MPALNHVPSCARAAPSPEVMTEAMQLALGCPLHAEMRSAVLKKAASASAQSTVTGGEPAAASDSEAAAAHVARREGLTAARRHVVP